jgi:DNA-binding transcriptional ArsR family regulator
MQVLDLTQSRTSRHLITLCDAGFLTFRRQGLWAMYFIDWESMDKYHIDLAGIVREAMKDNQTAILDRQKLAITEKIGLTVCSATGSKNGCKN